MQAAGSHVTVGMPPSEVDTRLVVVTAKSGAGLGVRELVVSADEGGIGDCGSILAK